MTQATGRTLSPSPQQSLVALPTHIARDTDIDFCSSCEFLDDARHCYDCLCFYCGRWSAPVSQLQRQSSASPSSLSLMQCGSCTSRNVLFGLTRVHSACHNDVLNTVPSTRSVNDLACAACGAMLLRGRVAVKPEVQDDEENSGPPVPSSASLPGSARALAVADGQLRRPVSSHATSMKQEDEDRGGSSSDQLLQAPYALPDMLQALLHTDPRATTFEVLHYGALCTAVRALQSAGAPRAATLPAAAAVEQLPTCPRAASRTVLSMSPTTGEWVFATSRAAAAASGASATSSSLRRRRSYLSEDINAQQADGEDALAREDVLLQKAQHDSLSLASRRRLAFIASQKANSDIQQLADEHDDANGDCNGPDVLLDTRPLIEFLKRKKKAAGPSIGGTKRVRSSSSGSGARELIEDDGEADAPLTTDFAGVLRSQLRQALEDKGLLLKKAWLPRRRGAMKEEEDGVTGKNSQQQHQPKRANDRRRRDVWEPTGRIVEGSIVQSQRKALAGRKQEARSSSSTTTGGAAEVGERNR